MKNIKRYAIDLLPHLPHTLKKYCICNSFSRYGGVSNKPFNELNVGEAVGDDPEKVSKNIEIIQKFLNVKKIFFAKQVHGTDFFHLTKNNISINMPPEADGIFTTEPDIGLMIKHADCQAVVIYDPVKRVIANIHCGWRGSAQKIISKSIKELKRIYGSRPKDLWVGISPSLGPCCSEFKGWSEKLPKWLHKFRIRDNHIDFWSASINELKEANIPIGNIYCAKICTVCNKDYFSYRREGNTGRLATIIALKNSKIID